jgi:hypothetical protein
MKCKVKFGNIAVGICLAALPGIVYADDTVANLGLPTAASFYTHNSQPLKSLPFNSSTYLWAANEADAIQGQTDVTPVSAEAEFHPPWISGRKAHQYLGLGTVLFAGLTALAAPGKAEGVSQQPRQTSGTTHTRLARTTAALAVATVITGLLYHWDDFHLEDGFADPDNQHVMLVGTGALMMLYAINKSAKSAVPTSHAATAELGAAAMVVAVKLTW